MNRDWFATHVAEPVWRHQRVPPQQNPLALADAVASSMRCGRGQTIYEEDGRTEYMYRVVSGIAARFLLKADGKRQIVDLLLPEDVFGFGCGGKHHFAAEAVVEDTVVARYPRARIDRLAASDPQLDRDLKEAMCTAASRLHELILNLGHTTAEEKVRAFLLNMAKRLPGSSLDMIALPFSREEIADYLALSVETVSRSLTLLRRRGVIRLAGTRRVKIVDRAEVSEDRLFAYAEP